MKRLSVQKGSNMHKILKTIFAVLLLASLFVTNTSIAAAAVVTTYRPLGNTYTTKPVYSWTRVGSTTRYKVQVYDIAAARNIINGVVGGMACDASTNRCSYKSSVLLTNNKSYKWRVAAGSGAFSAWKTFTVRPGINSQFNYNATGWLSQPGATWTTSGGTTIHTNGMANKWSSISYNAKFDNFTYSARMKRVSSTGASSGFWVRGTPTFDTTFNAVKNGYLFLYSQNGCFSVWKHIGGTIVAEKGWTISPSIVPNGWNVLKVTLDGSLLRFYINSVLVWSGSDSSFKNGQVALTMFGSSTTERLDVDWATLGMSDYYAMSAMGAASEKVEQGQVEILPDLSQPYGPEQAPAVP
jgi:hypothetical protein